jgi:glycosyltransferase involved in cell wall biosynthesis
MLAIHETARTWERVHAYIALTDTAKREFVRGGLPEQRLHVKPNFVPDPRMQGSCNSGGREGFVFVGRLSEEKGMAVLLEAWRQVVTEECLTVIGDGPLMPLVREAAASDSRIRVEGWRSRETVYSALTGRRAVVVPSQCVEMFPLSVVEAYAKGAPVIASRTPTLEELVVEEETGLLTKMGDARDLAEAMGRLLREEGLGERMGARARKTYEERYAPQENYRQLMRVYETAAEERDRTRR